MTRDIFINTIGHNQGCRCPRKLQVKQVNKETAGGAGA